MATFALANCVFQLVQLGDDIVGRLDSSVEIPESDDRSIVAQWYDNCTVYFTAPKSYYRHLDSVCKKSSKLENRLTSQRYLDQLVN